MRILLAEDDDVLADGISVALRQQGLAIDRVATGLDADHALSSTAYDLVIIDIGLPGMDGLKVLKRMRGRSMHAPVIVITARDQLDDRVSGLDLGADDYMTKPFDLPELEARIRALLRRGQWGNSIEIVCGPLKFDTIGRRVTVHDQTVELSGRELALLEILLQRLGRIVTKEQVAEHLYGWQEEVSHNAIEVNIHRLRKKLESAGFNIRTIRGLGYLVEQPA